MKNKNRPCTNRDTEIEYQEKVLKARLQALGIPTEDLEINR